MRLFGLILIFVSLNICAQSLKTYSGQYEEVDLSGLGDCGIATYTYKEGDKKRLYHGNFIYSDKVKMLKGRFVDDKQEGEWVLTEKKTFTVNKHFYTGNRIIKVSYKDGVPCGPFTISLVDSKTNTVKAFIRAQFADMKLIGAIKAKMNSSLIDFRINNFRSSYDMLIDGAFDERGLPIGTWKETSPTLEISEEFLEDGKFRVIEYNLSTGELIDEDRMPQLPNLIVDAANFAFRSTRLRSSATIDIPLFEFVDLMKYDTYRDEASKRIGSMFKSKRND